MDKEKIKNIGGVVVILIALVLTFQFFSSPRGADALLLLQQQDNGPEAQLVKDLFSILEDLERIKLDTTIFENPLFVSLEDHSVTLVAQERGRENPFAPLDSGGVAVAPGTTR